ncbi:cyclic nucleotide-binding domain-containing protein [archaeon]|nr:MAG: cyclic nucleotide-binding domain-containing protein [archaeon]
MTVYRRAPGSGLSTLPSFFSPANAGAATNGGGGGGSSNSSVAGDSGGFFSPRSTSFDTTGPDADDVGASVVSSGSASGTDTLNVRDVPEDVTPAYAQSVLERVGVVEHTRFGHRVAVMTAGDVLGERAVYTGSVRSATAIANTPVRAIQISRALFESIKPDVDAAMQTLMRVREVESMEGSAIAQHIHVFRRLAMDGCRPQSAVRDALLRIMQCFSPERTVEDVLEQVTTHLYAAVHNGNGHAIA